MSDILNGQDGAEKSDRSASVGTFFRLRYDRRIIGLWAFRGLLVGLIAVLLMNLHAIAEDRGLLPSFLASPAGDVPFLPAYQKSDAAEQVPDPRANITASDDVLEQDMGFTLEPDGRLILTGKIRVGTAKLFEEELRQHGDHVRSIELNSPGGSLDDALQMAREIRSKGLATHIADGALCASSCPLILAGGVVRDIATNATIGVHQFYVADNQVANIAKALASAQSMTAQIGRFLIEMDVDPQLWLHALDTPPQKLYYLSRSELLRYRLATRLDRVASSRSLFNSAIR